MAFIVSKITKSGGNETRLYYLVKNYREGKKIKRVISRLIRLDSTGQKSIGNFAAYFTYLIKMRKRRRSL